MIRTEPDIVMAQAGEFQPGSSLWHRPGHAETAGVLARFHCRAGVSGRRYYFTRYVSREEIADFTNILVFALDARGCRCAMGYIDHEGCVEQLDGPIMTENAPVCWEVRFLPQGRDAAEAIIADLAGCQLT